MGEPMVNGEEIHSQFLEHLTSYPVVSDSITRFKTNPYGAKSLEVADTGYTRLAKPFLPYLSTPYTYVAPYLARADSLGEQGLSKLDSRFPLIREDTKTIRGTLRDTAGYPVRFAGNVKDHVFDIYGAEYKKCGGDGLVASGKAVITTSLLLSQESLAWVRTLLQTAKEDAREKVNEKTNMQ